MEDVKGRLERAKALIAPALGDDPRPREQQDADAAELLMIGVEALGEVVLCAGRIATALERIAGCEFAQHLDVRVSERSPS